MFRIVLIDTFVMSKNTRLTKKNIQNDNFNRKAKRAVNSEPFSCEEIKV